MPADCYQHHAVRTIYQRINVVGNSVCRDGLETVSSIDWHNLYSNGKTSYWAYGAPCLTQPQICSVKPLFSCRTVGSGPSSLPFSWNRWQNDFVLGIFLKDKKSQRSGFKMNLKEFWKACLGASVQVADGNSPNVLGRCAVLKVRENQRPNESAKGQLVLHLSCSTWLHPSKDFPTEGKTLPRLLFLEKPF